MIETRSRMIFVNLPVRNLARTMDFFKQLGFTYNPQFTDQNAACMIISEQGYAMLLQDEFFKGFTSRELCDPNRQTEALLALSCVSREEVDEMVRVAIENGGKHTGKTMDLGFMYQSGFYDLDGHHWEVFWMDPGHVQK